MGQELVGEMRNRAVRKATHFKNMSMTRLPLIGQTFIPLSHLAQETCTNLLSTS